MEDQKAFEDDIYDTVDDWFVLEKTQNHTNQTQINNFNFGNVNLRGINENQSSAKLEGFNSSK